MAIKPRRQGIQRISENEEVRSPAKTSSTIRLGKTCIGCRKYYNYLRPEEKLCTACNIRFNDLKK